MQKISMAPFFLVFLTIAMGTSLCAFADTQQTQNSIQKTTAPSITVINNTTTANTHAISLPWAQKIQAYITATTHSLRSKIKSHTINIRPYLLGAASLIGTYALFRTKNSLSDAHANNQNLNKPFACPSSDNPSVKKPLSLSKIKKTKQKKSAPVSTINAASSGYAIKQSTQSKSTFNTKATSPNSDNRPKKPVFAADADSSGSVNQFKKTTSIAPINNSIHKTTASVKHHGAQSKKDTAQSNVSETKPPITVTPVSKVIPEMPVLDTHSLLDLHNTKNTNSTHQASIHKHLSDSEEESEGPKKEEEERENPASDDEEQSDTESDSKSDSEYKENAHPRAPDQSLVSQNQGVCPRCTFENHPDAIFCEICFIELKKVPSLEIHEAGSNHPEVVGAGERQKPLSPSSQPKPKVEITPERLLALAIDKKNKAVIQKLLADNKNLSAEKQFMCIICQEPLDDKDPDPTATDSALLAGRASLGCTHFACRVCYKDLCAHRDQNNKDENVPLEYDLDPNYPADQKHTKMWQRKNGYLKTTIKDNKAQVSQNKTACSQCTYENPETTVTCEMCFAILKENRQETWKYNYHDSYTDKQIGQTTVLRNIKIDQQTGQESVESEKVIDEIFIDNHTECRVFTDKNGISRKLDAKGGYWDVGYYTQPYLYGISTGINYSKNKKNLDNCPVCTVTPDDPPLIFTPEEDDEFEKLRRKAEADDVAADPS